MFFFQTGKEILVCRTKYNLSQMCFKVMQNACVNVNVKTEKFYLSRVCL